ncbi:hypothetical protein V8D89_007497 [Ganoderma adspersum]
MQDGPLSTVTTAERLSILRNRQKAWSKFEWRAKKDFKISTDEAWKLYGNVFARSEGKGKVDFLQVPSAIRGVKGVEWTIPDVGCNITEIAIDPTEDLLVVLEPFEDMSLSTGAPHPAATRAVMLTHEPEQGRYWYEIQTSRAYLGVLLSNEDWTYPSELLIWDWEAGTLRMRITSCRLYSWAFLTSRLLLLAHGGEGSDALYFLVIDLDSPRPSNAATVALSEVDYLCTFRYPPLVEDVTVLDMIICSEPGPVRRPPPALPVPFSVSHEDRLFVVTLTCMRDAYFDAMDILSLVPASTFLCVINTLAPGETHCDFAWAEWGPRGSRLMLPLNMNSLADACCAYGMKFAETHSDIRGGRSRKLGVMRDFNQLAVRKVADSEAGMKDLARHREDLEEQGGVRVVEDTTVLKHGVFQEEVTTAFQSPSRYLILSF